MGGFSAIDLRLVKLFTFLAPNFLKSASCLGSTAKT